MKPSTALSQSAAPFARLAEPSEMAFDIAATVEHMLLKPRLHTIPTVSELARAIEPDIARLNKRYVAMETALGYVVNLAQINGADAESMRHIGDLVAEGDK